MSNHTKEPWRVGKFGCVVSDDVAPGINGSDAVDYYGGHLVGESINEQNARRIVACVNALAGLTTEQIEDGAFAKMRDDRDFLLKKNAELLAALEHLHHNAKASGADMGLALDVAKAAISKAKGGAA